MFLTILFAVAAGLVFITGQYAIATFDSRGRTYIVFMAFMLNGFYTALFVIAALGYR